MKQKSVTLLLSILMGVVCVCAENIRVVENFHTLYNNGAGSLELSDKNKTGTTEFTTYTCSGGNAQFFLYGTVPNRYLCIYIEGSGAQVVTSEIAGLDSLVISYFPSQDYHKDFYVSTSPTGEAPWTLQTVQRISKGRSAVKLPTQGNYYVKIWRKGTDLYLREIEYYMVRCACFPYVAE